MSRRLFAALIFGSLSLANMAMAQNGPTCDTVGCKEKNKGESCAPKNCKCPQGTELSNPEVTGTCTLDEKYKKEYLCLPVPAIKCVASGQDCSHNLGGKNGCGPGGDAVHGKSLPTVPKPKHR